VRDVELRTAIVAQLRAPLDRAAPAPPADAAQLSEVLSALRNIAAADPRAALREKLVISGLTISPQGSEQQRCLECMYFLVHRRWCDLPELALPVEPDWWCRLWRA
jgi:hypothetical protein